MRGPFQGIDKHPTYMRFVLPMREDRPATGISRRPHWMTQHGALQSQWVYGGAGGDSEMRAAEKY
jgi:hypothetical protein